MRLARKCGWVNVDRMLDQVSPHQFDEWLAFERIQWDPLDKIVEVLALGFSALCTAWQMQVTPDHFKPWKAAEKEGRTIGPKRLARALGAGKDN